MAGKSRNGRTYGRTADLREQTAQSEELDRLIWANLEGVGYGK